MSNIYALLGMLFNLNEFYFFLKQKHVAEQCHKVPFEISNAHFKEKKNKHFFLQKNKVRIFISWYFMNTFYFHKCKKEEYVHMNQI